MLPRNMGDNSRDAQTEANYSLGNLSGRLIPSLMLKNAIGG
jgi:hypothetical protein